VGQLLDRHGSKIRGYKDSSGKWDNTQALIGRFPSLEVYVGSETLLLETLRAGGAGCISAGVNVQPAAVRETADNWRAENADSFQAAAEIVRTILEKSAPLIPAVKAVLSHLHRHDGWITTRPPLDPMPNAAAQRLMLELRACGLRAS